MPLSTSSSERALPDAARASWLLAGLAFGVVLVVLAEFALRGLGGVPNVRDSEALWHTQRERAARAEDRGIVLVGASRFQLGLDLEALTEATQRPVIQLAIDGSGYLDLVEDLSNDDRFRGTVLISGMPASLNDSRPADRASTWVASYHQTFKGLVSPNIEQSLSAKLQSYSALYANIYPLPRVAKIAIDGQRIPPLYLKTFPSRERSADYRLVQMPQFYIQRVGRNLGGRIDKMQFATMGEFAAKVTEVAADSAHEVAPALTDFQRLQAAISRLKSRGATVTILEMPSSGLIKAMEDIWYPSAYWREFEATLQAPIIRATDFPELTFELPDGSHLDQSQKRAFTRALVDVLNREGAL